MSKPLWEIVFPDIEKLIVEAQETQTLMRKNVEAAVAATTMWGAAEIAKDTPVDTGRLRASIGGEVIPTGGVGSDPAAQAYGMKESLTEIKSFEGVIGTNVHYAKYQEFGFMATGPKKLTPKQLRYLFASGILRKGPGNRVIPGNRPTKQVFYPYGVRGGTKITRRYVTSGVNVAINRRSGYRHHVKGKGFFRRNLLPIRKFFYSRMEAAVQASLQGRHEPVTR